MPATSDCKATALLQLRVLRFGLFQDWDVRVGVNNESPNLHPVFLRHRRDNTIQAQVLDKLSIVVGDNKKYQELYDRIALFYDPAETLYRWLFRKRDLRADYLKELEVGASARVLEVSVGFGLDISWGMLKRCRKRLAKWKRTAQLFQGEAEGLPFRDGMFDVVFHVGGINFFNDKARAIAEMIRVARPGTKVVIVDETEKVVKDIYEKTPLTRKYFQKRETAVACPVDLVPQNMLDIRADEIGDGRLYCLSFRKR